VVGHFSGSDVHFHARLKVPVKAKRASMASRKSSPPVSSDATSPIGQSSRRSSTSKTEAEALDRRASQQRRVQIPSRIQLVEDEQRRYPPSLTFSSSSNGTDSVVTTPALGYFSSPEIKKSSIHGTPASSPRDVYFSIEVPRSKSMPPTRASSPPTMSVSHPHVAVIPTVHKQNTHILPLSLTPESTTPLRISKRTPTSPSVPQFSPNPSQSVSQPIPSSSLPDASHSTYDERSKRQSVRMSDVQVGIGLSLLQDLANGMDSDSDEDQRPNFDQQYSPAAGTPDFEAALNRVGHRRDSLGEGTQESTVEGLGYTLSEEDLEERELAGKGKHAVIVDSQTTSAVTTRRASPNHSIYSDSNVNASHNTSLPLSASPISPSFSQSSFPTNERRLSLAPSAASTSEWEGASDIYDDYRYSRYSMASKMSRFSSSAGWTGTVPPTPPLPDCNSAGRARTDSSKSSRPDSCARSMTDSTNTRSNVNSSSISSETKGGSLLSCPPLLSEASEIEGQKPPGSHRQDDWKRTTIMKERTMSMESAASVYTQNSCSSAPSQDVIAPGSNPNNHFDTSSTSSNSNRNNGRPTPLLLSQSDVAKSPLLHTTWDTPLSSAIDGPSTRSSARSESSDLNTPVVRMVGGGVGSPRLTEEGRTKGSSDMMTTGNFGHGVNGVGIASAMRQRLETERRSLTASERNSFIQSDGLGHGIVVEDDDELPSRILDNSESTFTTMSPEPMYDEDEEYHSNEANTGVHGRRSISTVSSPEPDLMLLRTHLAPLTVANRTPSPTSLEGGSDEVRGAAGVEDEKEEPEEAPSPIVPNTPPLNVSSSTPPPLQASTSSSPSALPRLSSASTIRTGSPIDLRPPALALSDIREPGGPLVPGSNQRRSLFLPHPNAPKSLGDVGVSITGLAGPGPGVPMYIAAQQQGGWARGPGGMMPPASPNVIGVIRMALSVPPGVVIPPGQGPQGPPGQRSPLMIPMRGPTIYGRTETDLTGSLVPVPIFFSIDPPHVTAPHPSSNPIPTMAPPPQGPPTSKLAMPSSPTQAMTKEQQQSEPQHPPLRSLSLSTTGAAAVSASVGNAGPSAREGDMSPAEPKATRGLIPRPNFSPKSPGLRPRSRSLSSFNSTNTGVPQRR
jgi:TBC1 domain family member 10